MLSKTKNCRALGIIDKEFYLDIFQQIPSMRYNEFHFVFLFIGSACFNTFVSSCLTALRSEPNTRTRTHTQTSHSRMNIESACKYVIQLTLQFHHCVKTRGEQTCVLPDVPQKYGDNFSVVF